MGHTYLWSLGNGHVSYLQRYSSAVTDHSRVIATANGHPALQRPDRRRNSLAMRKLKASALESGSSRKRHAP